MSTVLITALSIVGGFVGGVACTLVAVRAAIRDVNARAIKGDIEAALAVDFAEFTRRYGGK